MAHISVKFNGGNTIVIYEGTGAARLSELGLHTAYELEHERTVRRLSSEQNAQRVKDLEDMIAERDNAAMLRNDELERLTAERDALQTRVKELEAALDTTSGACAGYVTRAGKAESALKTEQAAHAATKAERDETKAEWTRLANMETSERVRRHAAEAREKVLQAKVDELQAEIDDHDVGMCGGG